MIDATAAENDARPTRNPREHAEVARRKASSWFGPASVAALSILVSSIGLDRHSLWMDDGYSVWFSSSAGFLEREDSDGNMVLYYLLLRAWRLGGESDAWLRLLSVLWAAAGSALAVRLFARLTTGRLAWMAGLWLATSPMLVDLALQVRGYTQLYCLCTLLVYALLRHLEVGHLRWSLVAIGTAVAAIATHYFALVLVLALGAWAALEYTLQRHPTRRDVLLALAFAALLGLVYIALTSGDRHARLTFLTNWGLLIVPHYFYALSGHVRFGPLLLYAAVPAVLTALLALRVVRGGSDATLSLHRLVLLWIVLPFIVFALISAFVQPIYRDRYLVWLLPAFAALVPLLAGRANSERRWLMLLLTMCASNLVAVASHYGRASDEDWRAATSVVLEREAVGHDPIPLLFHAYGGRFVFDAYASREPGLVDRVRYPAFRAAAMSGASASRRQSSREALETITRRHPTLWLVISHIRPARPAELQRAIEWLMGARAERGLWQRRPRTLERVLETLDEAYDDSASWSLPGITLRRFERDASPSSDHRVP